MATHEMTLDVNKSTALAAEIITARVGDSGTTIKANLVKDGAALTGATAARFIALKPDRTYADQSASISGSTLTVTLDPKFLSTKGVIKTAYFRVTVNGKVETTPDIWITVLSDAESQADKPTGPYVSEVENLISQLNSVKSQMQTATNSANTAAGKANTAASSANTAATSANSAASAANTAATAANSSKAAADTATTKANAATQSANTAATAANEAAQKAIAAAGMVSQDKTIFLSYDNAGGVDYLTLTDESED